MIWFALSIEYIYTYMLVFMHMPNLTELPISMLHTSEYMTRIEPLQVPPEPFPLPAVIVPVVVAVACIMVVIVTIGVLLYMRHKLARPSKV